MREKSKPSRRRTLIARQTTVDTEQATSEPHSVAYSCSEPTANGADATTAATPTAFAARAPRLPPPW
ncbi:hypothetical protein ACF1FC_01540 [Streptomyces sp. NPDC014344]|uniref:hypothetical protein n=1 Tax=Streptomyces sp. NPDC014344 TaxID=3364871 RepID=UPI0036F74F11